MSSCFSMWQVIISLKCRQISDPQFWTGTLNMFAKRDIELKNNAVFFLLEPLHYHIFLTHCPIKHESWDAIHEICVKLGVSVQVRGSLLPDLQWFPTWGRSRTVESSTSVISDNSGSTGGHMISRTLGLMEEQGIPQTPMATSAIYTGASFCVCTQPMRDYVTLWCRLPLAERIHKMIPDIHAPPIQDCSEQKNPGLPNGPPSWFVGWSTQI